MLDVRISDRVEPLADALVEMLAVPPADPFAEEWVAVPSIGMRRWLAQRLSRSLGTTVPAAIAAPTTPTGSVAALPVGDGVSANVAMPFPDELRRIVLAADTALASSTAADAGGAATVAADPWEPERLLWSVLEVLVGPAVQSHRELAPLKVPPEGVSPVGRAGAIAELFDRYCRHRPDMVRAWLAGRSVDGSGVDLAEDRAWQPELFRLVADRIGVPSPPERMDSVVERVAQGELELDLPSRLSLFGMTTLPADVAALLGAVARHRDVSVLLLGASGVAAAAVADEVRSSGRHGRMLRRDDRSAELVHHPLLRSWGNAGREATVALALAGVGLAPASSEPRQMTLDLAPGAGAGPVDRSADQLVLDDAPAEAATLLARVQSDIRADRVPDGTFVLQPGDRSVQVHACTGPTRQVEVLRDALLHLLDADDRLTEGDVVVLCPRIEEFAPVIEAVLGPSADSSAPLGGDEGGDTATRAPLLRYRITDRRIRADVPLLGVLGALLELLPGRFSASAVADLLAMGPVSARFGLDGDDLALLDEWTVAANVRWGVDGAHRSSWHLPSDYSANTWAAGLDQLMAGVAIRGDDLTLTVGGVAPLPVAEGSVGTAARVAEAVRTLASVREQVAGMSATVEEWCAVIATSVDRLCSLPWAESWQRRRLDRVLAELRDRSVGSDGEPSDLPLTLSDVRGLLSGLLGGEPARAAFGTGAITFCSMSPLRSVPARVVCILGLDQDALPSSPSIGDDLLVAAPMVGDRDPRSEARQLLLEAVMSAQDAFVVTYGAVDVRTNLAVPAAVVLDEWWDVLADTCTIDGVRLRQVLRVEHPRHGFDPRNFSDDGLGDPAGPASPGPWAFDPLARDGAEALRGRVAVPGPVLLVPEPLEPRDAAGALELDRLRRSVVDPVREFVTVRLGVRLPWSDDAPVDVLPVELDGLARHRLGSDLLAARSAGLDTDRWMQVADARGALPPGLLRTEGVAQVTDAVDRIGRSAEVLGVGLDPSGRFEIDLDVGGRRLVGVVERCAGGDRPGPVGLHFSKAKPSQRIHAVIDLLALVATDPVPEWRAVVVSRTEHKTGDRADELVLVPLGDSADERREVALAALAELLAFRDRALCEPLPIFQQTSYHLGRGDISKARSDWTGPPTYPGESAGDQVRLTFGDLTFDELCSIRVDGRSPQQHAEDLWAVLDSAVVEGDLVEGEAS